MAKNYLPQAFTWSWR